MHVDWQACKEYFHSVFGIRINRYIIDELFVYIYSNILQDCEFVETEIVQI